MSEARALTDNQTYVLGWLAEFGPRTVGELVDAFGVGWYQSKVYAVLTQLERRGLVSQAKGDRSSLWFARAS